MTPDASMRSAPAADDDRMPKLRLVESTPGIAFVGTYPPRRCGIATFTRDLSSALITAGEELLPIAIAVTDAGGQYDYPREVRYEIRQGIRGDYERAAEFVNYSDTRLVSIQHEHGIFGGEDGAYVLDFLAALRVPAIATLHTVLRQPSEGQRRIVQRMASLCPRLVVMGQAASDLLASVYEIGANKVQLIPHGIPDLEQTDQLQQKARFGLGPEPMLLTFGLLGPNKGIETVIRALPAMVARHPKLRYFVVGLTHPVVARQQGEAYRRGLEREATRLGVRENLVFRDQFVTTEEVCHYLQAADIFVTPYQNEAQVTSGALSYAMGAGAAIVSTPYWHAQELLADGRGRLFPFGDSGALSQIVNDLLADPNELSRLRQSAHAFTRPMIWSRVGKEYLRLASTVMQEAPPSAEPRKPPIASSLPEARLDHLFRLTDDTGLVQHATFSVPARASGYCVDDNARALIVVLGAERLNPLPETRQLITNYLSYLHLSQRADGDFDNLMSYDRRLQPDSQSEDCLGRALWALGTTVALSEDDGHRRLARQMFDKALSRTSELGPRGTALTILGLASLHDAAPGAATARTTIRRLADRLTEVFTRHATQAWRWFEPTLTYDNALLPLSLFHAYRLTGERAYLRIARDSLDFLEDVCFEGDQLALVGNAGWHSRLSPKPAADEQAIDAAAFVLAFRGAYRATTDAHYLQRMRQAFAWFTGANRLGLPVYDFETGGCRDGLGAAEVNRNQGAESTVCFLMSLLEMVDVAGETGDDGPDNLRSTN